MAAGSKRVEGALVYLTPNAEIRWAEGKKRPMTDTFKGHDIAAGIIYQDANIKVTAVENTHFRFEPGAPPYGKYKSFSYRFDTLGRSFLFTGDTGWSEAVIDLAKGVDVLVTEVTSTDEVIGLMKRTGAWQAKTEWSRRVGCATCTRNTSRQRRSGDLRRGPVQNDRDDAPQPVA